MINLTNEEKTTDNIRTVDELGRITLPKKVRELYEININDNLGISIENETIVLKKDFDTDTEYIQVNELGLITIPANIRDVLKVVAGDKFEFCTDKAKISLKKLPLA